MDLVKKSPDLPTSTPVQPMDAPLAEKTYLVPKTQAPLAKPLPSTPASVNPTPQFRYMAPIKSKVNASDVIGWILSEKVCLSVKELLALAPEVRGISKKQPPRRGYKLCQWRHNPKWPIMLPLAQWTSTTNIFRPNQHCHFRRLRLLWITWLQSWASLTVAARSSLSARTYGKDWECQ